MPGFVLYARAPNLARDPAVRPALRYLIFDPSDTDEGLAILEAMASTPADQHPAVMAEVQQVLDWAWQHFPSSHGPVDEGHDWDHDLLVAVEPGGWHAVTLSLAGSPRFARAFVERFGDPHD